MKNRWLLLAALSGFFCVAFGAFSAHALEKNLSPTELVWIDKGLKYQMFHTLALMVLGVLEIANNRFKLPACRKIFNGIGGSWLCGILLFSGSLYLLALGAGKAIVWVTPIGGIAFLVGWGLLGYAGLRKVENE